MNMFGNNRNELPYEYTSQFQPHFPLTIPESTAAAFPSPPPPLDIPTGYHHDPVAALRSELGYASSCCSSYGGSPTSYGGGGAYSPTSYGGGGAYSPTATIIQRSISSHSLHKNPEIYNNSPMHSSLSPRYFEPETATSVRKAMSTGDLQVVNLAQQHNQRSSISSAATESSIIESMNRANPYSPEEKRERIERYRSKRNLRNFNKKIKYECRKTLADSRPRIRGRFARNDEIEKNIPQGQWDQTGIEEYDDEDDDNWIHFLDAFSANLMP
ncbi:hypothetical protein ABFS83_04G190000 [Erythranthe nasuta]